MSFKLGNVEAQWEIDELKEAKMPTCRMPVVSLIAWEQRGPGQFIFVRIPTEYGRYLRTDRSVAYVPCPASSCNATVGEPCKFNGKYSAGTHADRRTAYTYLRKTIRTPPADDVVAPNDGARITLKQGVTR